MYYIELDKFPREVVTDEYRFPDSTGISIRYWNIKLSFFKKETIDLFSKHGLDLKDGEIFKKSPGKSGAVHTDVIWNPSRNSWDPWYCALNINLHNTTSLMYWISTTAKPIFPDKARMKLDGIHYGARHNANFSGKEYTVLDKFQISKPTLVKTDVAHSVRNLDTKDRWCISLRFKGNPTFEECAKKLEGLI